MNGRFPRRQASDGIAKPKSLKDVPAYLFKVTKGFVSRLFYIVRLVWEAAPPVLIIMAFLCVLDGVLPVIGAYISKDLLNEVARLIGASSMGSVAQNIFLMQSAGYPLPSIFTSFILEALCEKRNNI